MRRLFTFVAALVIVSGLLTVVGVLPASTYTRQRRDTSALSARLAAIQADNASLQHQVRRLRSDTEIARLAREQFGMVLPGQEVYAIPSLLAEAQVGTPIVPPQPLPHQSLWRRLQFWR